MRVLVLNADPADANLNNNGTASGGTGSKDKPGGGRRLNVQRAAPWGLDRIDARRGLDQMYGEHV